MERVKVKGVYYKRVRYSDIPGCDVKTDLVCPFCDLKAPECNTVCGEGCVLKKEEPKTKTKRVVVIWFGHVPECTDYVDIRARQSGNEWDKGKEFKVDTIDPDRLKYKEALKGEQVFDTNGGFYEYDGPDGFKSRFLILAPPTPEPETVEQVLERMPKTKSYYGADPESIDDYWVDMIKWEKDLKAAQERSNP